MIGVLALCVQPTLDMLAGVATDVLHMGKDGLALLAATFGCGAMSGGAWIAWRGRNEGLVRILLAGVATALCALTVFAISQVLWLSLPSLFIAGCSLVIGSTSASSLIQNAVEPALRARVVALDGMISMGGPSFGAIIIGWAGTQFGVQLPLFAAAMIGLIVFALARAHVKRETGRLEGGLRAAIAIKD
jgi:predicted MFS family arabinose efflux permease